jgi:hypothetical protein
MGDSAYGSAEMLGWLVYEHGIEPHVTVFDKSKRQDGTFSRDAFTYDHAGDVYYCPPWPTIAAALTAKHPWLVFHETNSEITGRLTAIIAALRTGRPLSRRQ